MAPPMFNNLTGKLHRRVAFVSRTRKVIDGHSHASLPAVWSKSMPKEMPTGSGEAGSNFAMRLTVLSVAYGCGPAPQPCRVGFIPAWHVSKGSTCLATAASDVTQIGVPP